MIKFNNYPPLEDGDAEYTDAARELISKRRHVTIDDEKHYDRSTVRLYAYGEAIGQVLMAATNNNTETVRRIAQPLIGEAYELRDHIDRMSADALSTGINSTLREESVTGVPV